MKIQFLSYSLMASLALLLAPAAQACQPGYQQINSNNSIVMLGGTAQGPIKQFVLGEFGKDVNQQKRMIGEFDPCGVLQRADIRYDKQEGRLQIELVQNFERVSDGWLSSYTMTVSELGSGAATVINDKRGTTHYRTNNRGMIVSSADAFMLKGESGFTETTHFFDRKSRLIRSTSRGTDANSNGVLTYRWNKKNQLVASDSERQKMTWDYDREGRELRLNTRSDSPISSMTTQDECQLWDDRDNCTLSYAREMEVFPGGIVRRNITAAYRYEYWKSPGR
ncbi:MAG TPA: hypothetical protein DD850_13695 [Erwinia persicina]|uniref:YD repeat-containing protein n=1 Tax=Erwinia persicina TaxID=55211 RepID=A0ABR8ZM90_9GAMM|nr:hypothetical protein [Erwinia persicina]AXU94901.1 hypothetical protein CI789_06480 [Erwinia persicina]MBC3943739.1 hypothetical protein [Erwinia persicina]MBD8104818.1 hypothetical protein [Erwinia persicina]MBD8167036.1 hypothetical protein [Erwinia persicina]MBD8207964.1 hypothetical protein [Erwinia persicina]